MTAPVSMPSGSTLVSSLWRALVSLRFSLRLRGNAKERGSEARTRFAPGSLGATSFDWDGPDTSLTQAELEVLK